MHVYPTVCDHPLSKKYETDEQKEKKANILYYDIMFILNEVRNFEVKEINQPTASLFFVSFLCTLTTKLPNGDMIYSRKQAERRSSNLECFFFLVVKLISVFTFVLRIGIGELLAGNGDHDNTEHKHSKSQSEKWLVNALDISTGPKEEEEAHHRSVCRVKNQP